MKTTYCFENRDNYLLLGINFQASVSSIKSFKFCFSKVLVYFPCGTVLPPFLNERSYLVFKWLNTCFNNFYFISKFRKIFSIEKRNANAHGMKSYKKLFFLSKSCDFFEKKRIHAVIERYFSYFWSDMKIFLITDSPFNVHVAESVSWNSSHTPKDNSNIYTVFAFMHVIPSHEHKVCMINFIVCFNGSK